MGTEREDAGEVIELAEKLRVADEAASEGARLEEIGREVGVPAPYVARAVEELARRRARRRKVLFGALVVAAIGVVAAMFVHEKREKEKAAHPLAGVSVAFDVRHGIGSAQGAAAVVARGGTTMTLDGAFSDASLAAASVLVLLEPRAGWSDGEFAAVDAFVRSGRGLVIGDLGWSWTTYAKRPLEELPANRLGQRLGFSFDDRVLSTSLERPAAGVPWPLASTGWVPCGIELRGDRPRVFLRDDRLRPIAGVIDVGKGRVVVVGHAGTIVENPAFLAYAVALAAGR